MVELLVPGESRTTKLRRDLQKMRDLYGRAKREVNFSGSPKRRLLATIDWYQAQNNCGVCRHDPEHSFSHTVRRATEKHGALVGLTMFGRLWARRTLTH